MNKKVKNNYLDKEKFLKLILEYQKFGPDEMNPKSKNELGKMILSLVNHIAMRPNFNNYSYLEEMKSNAILSVWKGLNTFNVEKTTNAFSYFTTAIFNAFVFIINKEKALYEKNQDFQEETHERLEAKNEYRFAKKVYSQEFKEGNNLF